MEEKNNTGKSHKIELLDRKSALLTGVKDVGSFDTQEVLLETIQGMLLIRGEGLHVNRLNLERGEIDVDGRIDSLVYMESKEVKKTGQSLLARLFR